MSEAEVIIFSAMFSQMTHPQNNEQGIQAMNKSTYQRDGNVYASFNYMYFELHADRNSVLLLSYKHTGFKKRDEMIPCQ